MTREEAAKMIKDDIRLHHDYLSGKYRRALNLAIKALQQPEPCEDAVSREAVLDKAYAYGNGLEPEGYCVNVEDIQALQSVTPKRMPPAQPDSCEFYDTESHFCALHRPSVQPDRSLWFHIGETCVDESKGIISAEEAIKKIRELLRAADLILVEIASPDTFTEPKFHHEDWSEIL